PDRAGLGAVAIGNPQSWNRYGYALNNPLSFVDPKGLTIGSGCDNPTGDDPCFVQVTATISDEFFFEGSGGGPHFEPELPFQRETVGGGFCSARCQLQNAIKAAIEALNNADCAQLIDRNSGQAQASLVLGTAWIIIGQPPDATNSEETDPTALG